MDDLFTAFEGGVPVSDTVSMTMRRSGTEEKGRAGGIAESEESREHKMNSLHSFLRTFHREKGRINHAKRKRARRKRERLTAIS